MYTSHIPIDISSIEILSAPEHPWMVFIHGFGGTRHMWNKQVEQFKNDYNLLIIELPVTAVRIRAPPNIRALTLRKLGS